MKKIEPNPSLPLPCSHLNNIPKAKSCDVSSMWLT